MTPRRKKRLIAAAVILIGVSSAVGLTLVALQQNINLFHSPTEVSQGKTPQNKSFRLGGMVVNGSVKRSNTNLDVSFDLTDTAKTVTVHYTGILPDLFREGQGIVTLGKMSGDRFIASQVLAKHDENYMSPEVRDALKAASKSQYTPAESQPENYPKN